MTKRSNRMVMLPLCAYRNFIYGVLGYVFRWGKSNNNDNSSIIIKKTVAEKECWLKDPPFCLILGLKTTTLNPKPPHIITTLLQNQEHPKERNAASPTYLFFFHPKKSSQDKQKQKGLLLLYKQGLCCHFRQKHLLPLLILHVSVDATLGAACPKKQQDRIRVSCAHQGA